MADFKTQLVRKEDIANGTMAFYFEKPEGLTYQAGQHPTVRLINPPETDDEGNERTFSFITIPSDNEIGFATRMRDSAFKRTLKNAPLGYEVEILNPRGSMILPTNASRPLVMLAGGIGITPFISMIRQATEENSEQKIYLFHSNRTLSDAPFYQNLMELSQKNSNFVFIPIFTKETPQNWQGETEHLNEEMIKKYIGSLDNTVFYLAGPAGLVNASMEILTQVGIDSLFIKTEDFGDYK